MSIFEIILIGIGLSMDASAVSMTSGMCYRDIKLKHTLSIAISFGLFQGIMPIIGYYAGSLFSDQISQFDHWIALILLSFIGIKMIIDAVKNDDEEMCKQFSYKVLLIQSIATSIDALAVGISFAAMNVNIFVSSGVIAITTLIFSLIAVYLGKKIGDKLNSKAEIFGGTILILIGLKIFIEHVFIG